jgi:hypothetical protein
LLLGDGQCRDRRRSIDFEADAGDDRAQSSSIFRQLTSPSGPSGAADEVFSATVSVGIRLNSW